mmetsp:Transcript_43631/g.138956  ORF Transcript_43631/g.138956 Transcript_43631/m.138956 type:complete len:213 (+) Transcript_43631:504-1142(+)
MSAAPTGFSKDARPSKVRGFHASTQLPLVLVPSGKTATGPCQPLRARSAISASVDGCCGAGAGRGLLARASAASREHFTGAPSLAGKTNVGQTRMPKYSTSVMPWWFTRTIVPWDAEQARAPPTLGGAIFSLRWSARASPSGMRPTAKSASPQPGYVRARYSGYLMIPNGISAQSNSVSASHTSANANSTSRRKATGRRTRTFTALTARELL